MCQKANSQFVQNFIHFTKKRQAVFDETDVDS